MALKSKITNEMLEDIENYAEDQYSLAEMFNELKISKKLMKDEQILNVYEKGLVKFYISMKALGLNDKDFIEDKKISIEQSNLWSVKYNKKIESEKQRIKNNKRNATKQFTNPLYSGMTNILNQNRNSSDSISIQQISDDILGIVKRLQDGETTDLLTTLVSNNLQLQMFNKQVTYNLMGKAGEALNNFELLSKMQLRVMNEVRKNTMAINEIVNPKRTTFIKEANQHNHLHQENSEKKLKNENELQKVEQLSAPEYVKDTEIIPPKQKVYEDK